MVKAEPIVFFDGAFMPASQAAVTTFSPAIICGPSPYETLRAYRGPDGVLNVFRADAHFRRLRDTLRLLRYDASFDFDTFAEALCELVRLNDVRRDAHFRLHAFAAERSKGPLVANRTSVSIRVEEREEPESQPVRARLSPWRRPRDASQHARAKTLGNPSFLRPALMEANAEGFDQVIFLNDDGGVSEGAYANIFVVRDGSLATPTRTCSILEGVTRDTVIALAGDLGIPCAERRIDPSELYLAEEIFVCATGLELVPIGALECHDIGGGAVGPVTRRLMTAYAAAVRGELEAHADWLMPLGATLPQKVGARPRERAPEAI